ncbi:hypothetical protein VTK73DRAFT_6999 [Phialemonium thermophilum]|uniref:Phosphoribulokinase/uridine kinase domain-containing protein n=1 Tax=Phialemonium thermophilum TaxID=223376 RepID=A0ABR3WH88_9PEZI
MLSGTVERLSFKLWAQLEAADPDARIVIGIAGVPGSGKSTLAHLVCRRVNQLHKQDHPDTPAEIAIDVPMDGFHYTRAHLATLSREADAIHRRGAAFTYDAEGFRRLVQALVSKPAKRVMAPSFDHKAKDPADRAIAISADTRVVLLEGNYCALNRPPWSDAAKLMTELWYIDASSDVVHERLARRHLASGIVADEKEAWTRATGTDELNAEDIRSNRLDCEEVVPGF